MVLIAHPVAANAGQTLLNKLYVLQVRDTANALVYELYLDAGRTLWLSSPAGGLRSTAIDQSTAVVAPNNGTGTLRVEVSALKNTSVVVRVNGIDRITLTGLTGATTGNQRYLVAGIDRYDGNAQNAPVTLYHSQLWATTLGWSGDGGAANQTLERFTGRWDKKLDASSGLIEMGARPYDPALGRSYAVDPIEGGAANAYDYAYQDSINLYDLDGTIVPCGSTGCAGGGVPRIIKSSGKTAASIREKWRVTRDVISAWDQATFPSRSASIRYHYGKHVLKPGRTESIADYTRDAQALFARYGGTRRAITIPLKAGGVGVKIRGPHGEGGIYTQSGKIISYWYG